jgi:hypothetical protein
MAHKQALPVGTSLDIVRKTSVTNVDLKVHTKKFLEFFMWTEI